MKNNIYQTVTNKIIQLLEKGMTPWRKPWTTTSNSQRPLNYKSKHVYKGINFFILFSIFDDPFFLTFNQIRDLGGKVLKGEKATPVFYWNWLFLDANGKSIKDEDKAVKKVPLLKYYNVFNASQIEGIEFDYPITTELKENKKMEKCENIVKNCKGLTLKFQRNEAFYSPLRDFVNMPKIETFKNSQFYYSTLFHELGHWTGHKTRLNRFKGKAATAAFGSAEYSKEELIAEMTAAFLCHDCQINTPELTQNSAAYLEGWINVLKSDSRLITAAATAAEKAANLINPK